MARTVAQAFNDFMDNKVNLKSSEVTTARSSRNWLLGEIAKFPSKDASFPTLNSDYNLHYGSFARKTKTNPLNDIDLMIGLNGDGCTYDSTTNDPENIKIYIPSGYTGPLSNFRHTGQGDTNTLSSRRVVNKFISSLSSVYHYRNATMKRDGEAATLKLDSYPWNFDIVPCFHTQEEAGSVFKNRYIIPNAKGDWRVTDPRIDRDRLSAINQKCTNKVLPMIRLIKQWNQYSYRARCPSSYLLETMISDYYKGLGLFAPSLIESNMRLEILKVFEYLKNNIYSYVEDPKEITGNINRLEYDVQVGLESRLINDISKINSANQYESSGDHKRSINIWREVFGDHFPSYTGN